MEDYKHGVYGVENDTPDLRPDGESSVQVVVGTAPINLVPTALVNKPVLVRSMKEAKALLGYSESFDKYTLCQAMYASLELFRNAPIVMINVLDPNTHTTDVSDKAVNVESLKVIEKVEGILLDTLSVKEDAGVIVYELDTDYTAEFNDEGHVVISILATGAAKDETNLKLDYSLLDASKVTEADIIGSYDSATNIYKGIDVVRQIYPQLNEVASLILAPGYSHLPAVARKLESFVKAVNGNINTHVILDALSDTVNRAAVIQWKKDNLYTSKGTEVVYLKSKIVDKVIYTSAILAAAMQNSDAEYDGMPSRSPSNMPLPITAAVLEDGTEVYLDQLQANELNAEGIITLINAGGFRAWGNNTAAYPTVTDPKDRFVLTRRQFDFINNDFMQTFFSKVDDPTNYRLVEEVVDTYNLKLNAYQAAGLILSGKIRFNKADNPIEKIVDGEIQFLTELGANIPTRVITNVSQYDVTALIQNLGGN